MSASASFSLRAFPHVAVVHTHEGAPVFMHGGLTVNGVTAPPWPMTPKPGAQRY